MGEASWQGIRLVGDELVGEESSLEGSMRSRMPPTYRHMVIIPAQRIYVCERMSHHPSEILVSVENLRETSQ